MGPSSSYSDSGPQDLRAWDAPVLRTRADRSRVSRFRAAKQSGYQSRVLETASMAGTGVLLRLQDAIQIRTRSKQNLGRSFVSLL